MEETTNMSFAEEHKKEIRFLLTALGVAIVAKLVFRHVGAVVLTVALKS